MFRYCTNSRPSSSSSLIDHVYCSHTYRMQQEIVMSKIRQHHTRYFRGIITDTLLLSTGQPRRSEQCCSKADPRKRNIVHRLHKPKSQQTTYYGMNHHPMHRKYTTSTTKFNTQSSLNTTGMPNAKSKKIAIIRIFRILQRQCIELEQVIKQKQQQQQVKGSKSPKRRSKKKNNQSSSETGRFLVQVPVDPRRAGSYRFVPPSTSMVVPPAEFTDPELNRIAPLLRFFYLQHDPRERNRNNDELNFDSDDDDDSSSDGEDDDDSDIDEINLTDSDEDEEEEDELDIDSVLRFFHLQKEYENIKMDYDYGNDDDDDLDEDKEVGDFITSFVEYILQNEYNIDNKIDLFDSNDESDSQDDTMVAIDTKEYEMMRNVFESLLQKQSVLHLTGAGDYDHHHPKTKKEYENVALWTSIDEIRRTIRYVFRKIQSDDNDDPDSIRRCIKYAIDAYKFLNIQRNMIPCTFVSSDKNVQITVTCQYIGRSYIPSFRRERQSRDTTTNTTTTTIDSSLSSSIASLNEVEYKDEDDNNKNTNRTVSQQDEEPKYLYAYRIRIENISPTDKIQLLGRTWEIYDSYLDDPDDSNVEQTEQSQSDKQDNTGQPFRIDAPNDGVVGRFPVLQPGMGFEYISGAEAGPYGRMKGSFHFATLKNTSPNNVTNHRRRNTTEVKKDDDDDNNNNNTDDPNGYDSCLTKQESKLFKNRFTVPVTSFPLRAV